jgi:hypothetical protein
MRAPCEAPAYIVGCEAEPDGKEEEPSVERATCMAILCRYYVSGYCVGSAAAMVDLGRGEAGGKKEAVRWTAEASWAGCRDAKQTQQDGEECETDTGRAKTVWVAAWG